MGKAEPRPSRFDDAVAWAVHAIVANPRVCWWVLGVLTVAAVLGRLGSGGEWIVFTGALGGALLARRDPPVVFKTEPVVIVAVMLLLSLWLDFGPSVRGLHWAVVAAGLGLMGGYVAGRLTGPVRARHGLVAVLVGIGGLVAGAFLNKTMRIDGSWTSAMDDVSGIGVTLAIVLVARARRWWRWWGAWVVILVAARALRWSDGSHLIWGIPGATGTVLVSLFFARIALSIGRVESITPIDVARARTITWSQRKPLVAGLIGVGAVFLAGPIGRITLPLSGALEQMIEISQQWESPDARPLSYLWAARVGGAECCMVLLAYVATARRRVIDFAFGLTAAVTVPLVLNVGTYGTWLAIEQWAGGLAGFWASFAYPVALALAYGIACGFRGAAARRGAAGVMALGLLVWLATLGGALLWHSVADDLPAPFAPDPATPLIHTAFTVANCLLVVAAVRSVAPLRRFVAAGLVLAGAAALGAWSELYDPLLAVAPVLCLAASFSAAIPFVLCARAVASMTAVPVEHPSIADWNTDPLLGHSSSRGGTSS